MKANDILVITGRRLGWWLRRWLLPMRSFLWGLSHLFQQIFFPFIQAHFSSRDNIVALVIDGIATQKLLQIGMGSSNGRAIQATTALAETTFLTDFWGLTVFSAIYVVHCN